MMCSLQKVTWNQQGDLWGGWGGHEIQVSKMPCPQEDPMGKPKKAAVKPPVMARHKEQRLQWALDKLKTDFTNLD